MELLRIALAANETKQFAKAGRYFEIIESNYSITVQFNGANGAQSDSIVGGLSGLFLEDPFSHFSVTNGAVAQTVTLLLMEIGRGGSRRQPGNVSIVDNVGAGVQTQFLSDLTVGQVFTAFVLPAANLNGIIVRAAMLETTAGAGGSSNVRLLAAPTAPVSLTPGASSLMLCGAYSSQSSDIARTNNFDMRRIVPPGWGLYFAKSSSVAAPAPCGATVSFEVL